MSFRRDLAGMSSAQWAVVCVRTFIVSMGAALGLLTPSPNRLDQIRATLLDPLSLRSNPRPNEIEVIRPATAGSSQAQSSFPLCGRGAGDCVIDGDTFRFRGEKIRIADIDAPETGGAKCADEADLGQRATFRLAELLSSRPFRLEAIGSRDVDSYGRKLRIVANGGGSIGAQLVDEGLARPWNGGRRPWC